MHTSLAHAAAKPRWYTPVALVSVASLSVVVFACSSTTPTIPPEASTQVCPSTIEEATATPVDGGEGYTSACHVRGYVCPVSFGCTNGFRQQANCTCELPDAGGPLAFVCTLQVDNSLVPPDTTDASTLCVATEITGDASINECPDKTMAYTSMISCTNPGQICYYTGVTCPGDVVPKTDNCECVANVNGDAGLYWSCDINNCN